MKIARTGRTRGAHRPVLYHLVKKALANGALSTHGTSDDCDRNAINAEAESSGTEMALSATLKYGE